MPHAPESPRETALVTGASSGIGEEFARLLASKGYDLVLVARSRGKLEALAASLKRPPPAKIEILPLDLSGPAAPQEVRRFVDSQALAVDLLVNNAGYGTFGPFAEGDLEADLGQIRVNVMALTHLTRLFLPGMLERRRGRILNVASTAAFQPGPLMSVYYATKAYVLSFSEGLANELQGTGVTVTCLCPGPTRTEFMARAKMPGTGLLSRRSLMMEPAEVALRGYDALLRGRRLVIPGVLNRLLAHSTRLGSRGLSARVVRRIMDGIRESAPVKSD